eukprot:scaffold46036_cov46-Phaeocystis_antarctica.AAC.1
MGDIQEIRRAWIYRQYGRQYVTYAPICAGWTVADRREEAREGQEGCQGWQGQCRCPGPKTAPYLRM